MTYAEFLCLFLILPILILSLLLRKHLLERRYWLTTGLLCVPVLICMAPWDHTAALWGIWGWTPRQTWQIRVWLVPLEEYLFCVLETILGTMALYALTLWLCMRGSREGNR